MKPHSTSPHLMDVKGYKSRYIMKCDYRGRH